LLFVVDCCSGFAQSPQPAMIDVSTVKELPIQWRLGDKAIILVPSSNDGSINACASDEHNDARVFVANCVQLNQIMVVFGPNTIPYEKT